MNQVKYVRKQSGCCNNKYNNVCNFIILIGDLYIFYLTAINVYNYSFDIGYNCIGSIGNMNNDMLINAITSIFKLIIFLVCICFWSTISSLLTPNKCKCSNNKT
jgi:hypothetical protein